MEKKPLEKGSLDHYLSLPYSITLVPSPEGGFAVRINELTGCISQGETVEDAYRMIEDAKREWLMAALDMGVAIPEPTADPEEFSGKFIARLPKSLHKTLVEKAREEGVSLNQYVVYQLSKGVGMPVGNNEQAAASVR